MIRWTWSDDEHPWTAAPGALLSDDRDLDRPLPPQHGDASVVGLLLALRRLHG